MISFLSLISNYMGMINVKSKFKNQIYTIMAFAGNWYLLYIGIRFLMNGKLIRGLGLVAIFIIFLYFSILNIYYYFSNKKMPYDISPYLEKYIGGKPDEIKEKEALNRRLNRIERARMSNGNQSGVFSNQMLLPAHLTSNEAQKRNINIIAEQMEKNGLLYKDYGGRSDAELKATMSSKSDTFYAIGDNGAAVPFAEIKMVDNRPVLFAGINQIEELPVGVIDKVGLSSYRSAKRENHLYLASTVLVGGEKKMAGRSGLITENEKYAMRVEVAYKRRVTSMPKN